MRVGLLTSGGDCQALNPTMRGVVLTLKNLSKKVEIIGFANGYKGLIYNHYSIMSPSAFVNILNNFQHNGITSRITQIQNIKVQFRLFLNFVFRKHKHLSYVIKKNL